MDYPKSDYKEYPKSLPPDDFWGQVRRTVFGKQVSEEQIGMIVAAIEAGLDLQPTDTVLDLGCGNGALSRYLFDRCAALFGVDSSPYLIEVARANFAAPPKYQFALGDAASYVASAPDPLRFSKVLCYGTFPFFSAAEAAAVLKGLRDRFRGVRRIMLGNLADKDRAHRFYPAGRDFASELSDPTAQIGIWYAEDELRRLARATGWELTVSRMPIGFYAAHYRFDAILDRAA